MLASQVPAMKRLKLRAKQRFGWFEPLAILPFRGYGTARRVTISGRVLEEDGVVTRPPRLDASLYENLRTSLRRLGSDDIPGAKVRVRLGRVEAETQTDQEGYFDATLIPEAPLEPGWHDVELELLDSVAGQSAAEATGQVLVPPPDAAYGVVSDVDDTVVYTGVTRRLRMVRTVLFNNAHTRLPFPGVGAFYRALKLGPDGMGANPIFYVSRSPWHLYDLFEAFLRAHDIPRGPLFLRDFRLFERPGRAAQRGQDKLTRIRALFDLYPSLPFVLIGDSGQKDPECYRQVALDYPGRVKAIYIRDVVSRRRDHEVHALARELEAHRVPVILIRETMEAARHAVEAGLITADMLDDVAERKRRDE